LRTVEEGQSQILLVLDQRRVRAAVSVLLRTVDEGKSQLLLATMTRGAFALQSRDG
jgi:hypothetical protein